jgi:hypothetical protein
MITMSKGLTVASRFFSIILTCGDVSAGRAHPSAYGREQSWCASAHARADGCGDGCEWNGHVSVYGYVYDDERVGLS